MTLEAGDLVKIDCGSSLPIFGRVAGVSFHHGSTSYLIRPNSVWVDSARITEASEPVERVAKHDSRLDVETR